MSINHSVQNECTLSYSYYAVSDVKSIPSNLFLEGYSLVSFDAVSLFTNIPRNKTIDIALKRVFNEKLDSYIFL